MRLRMTFAENSRNVIWEKDRDRDNVETFNRTIYGN